MPRGGATILASPTEGKLAGGEDLGGGGVVLSTKTEQDAGAEPAFAAPDAPARLLPPPRGPVGG